MTQGAAAHAERSGASERRIRTRGQAVALAGAEAMLASHVPHALLLVGPAGVGKTTLALDLAAALLCVDPIPARRPCRVCRACRAVDHGNHPDLHRLGPTGAGAVIRIEARRKSGPTWTVARAGGFDANEQVVITALRVTPG